MIITNVYIRKVFDDDSSNVKAIVSIEIDGVFMIHDVRIVNSHGQHLFISFPSKRDQTGTYRNTAHPINNDLRNYISDKILKAYKPYQIEAFKKHGYKVGDRVCLYQNIEYPINGTLHKIDYDNMICTVWLDEEDSKHLETHTLQFHFSEINNGVDILKYKND